MSEEENLDKSNNDEKKKTRRTRKDEDGRNFTCGCGKSYLSYPALYTHTKTKHDGKPPPINEVKPSSDMAIITKIDLDEDEAPLKSIEENIRKYFPGDKPENYPTPISEKSRETLKMMMRKWEEAEAVQLADESLHNPQTSMELIFGRFLSEIKPTVKSEGLLFVEEFIHYIYQGIIDEKGSEDYCEKTNGSQLPYCLNDLVYKVKFPSKSVRRGSPLANITLLCKIIYFFGAWIFEKAYTNLTMKFNTN